MHVSYMHVSYMHVSVCSYMHYCISLQLHYIKGCSRKHEQEMLSLTNEREQNNLGDLTMTTKCLVVQELKRSRAF